MEQYLLKIRKNGYKLTSVRRGIIKSLLKASKPVTARKIYQLLHDKNINISSVYRNLCLFKSIGFVFEEEHKRESYYYISDEHHHHIYCDGCGYIECIPCEYKKIKSLKFKRIEHRIVLKGRCKKCVKA